MYRFKDSPQDLSELVIDALNLFGHGIRHIWMWAMLVAVFSLVGPYLIFESIELIGPEIHTTVRWSAFALNFLLSLPGAFCISMIARRLFVLGTDHLDKESVSQSMAICLRHLPKVYVGLLLTSLVSILGWFIMFIPGIFLAIVFTFVMPLILLDDYGIVGAFKESWHLVVGNWWRIFAMLLIPLLILAMVSMMPVHDAPILSVVANAFVIWFDIPMLITFMLTMFYDTKLRHNVPLHLHDDEQPPSVTKSSDSPAPRARPGSNKHKPRKKSDGDDSPATT